MLAPSNRIAVLLVGIALAAVACGDGGRSVQEGDSISVHVVGRLDDGTQFESSRARGAPLPFVVGPGPDFAVLRGMQLGEVRTLRIPARDAFGDWDAALVVDVGKDEIPGEVVVGDNLFGAPVVSVTEDFVQIDTNNPNAGHSVTFEIQLVSFDD